jgi:hypothetical protein
MDDVSAAVADAIAGIAPNGVMPRVPLPEVSTGKQLAAFLQTTEAALAQDRYLRRGVPWVKIGARVRYLRADVLNYLAANRSGGGAA